MDIDFESHNTLTTEANANDHATNAITNTQSPQTIESPVAAYQRMLLYYQQYRTPPDHIDAYTSSEESYYSSEYETSTEDDAGTQVHKPRFKYVNILKRAAERLRAADEAMAQLLLQNDMDPHIEH